MMMMMMLMLSCGDRRKDCLRQFLVVLYERGELELIVNLPYCDSKVVLEPEVCNATQIETES